MECLVLGSVVCGCADVSSLIQLQLFSDQRRHCTVFQHIRQVQCVSQTFPEAHTPMNSPEDRPGWYLLICQSYNKQSLLAAARGPLICLEVTDKILCSHIIYVSFILSFKSCLKYNEYECTYFESIIVRARKLIFLSNAISLRLLSSLFLDAHGTSCVMNINYVTWHST